MNTHADKTREYKTRSAANGLSQVQSARDSTFQFVDNRPEAVSQRRLQKLANNSPQSMQLEPYARPREVIHPALSSMGSAIAQRKLNENTYSQQGTIQRYRISGADEKYPEGSVTATKKEIFSWLDGADMWSQVSTEWCLIGGSAHVEIVEHLLLSNFAGVVDALVVAMGAVPPKDEETRQEYIDFFVNEVMTTEDLDIAVSDASVAAQFPANQSEARRLICPEYTKPAVDLLVDPGAPRFRLPDGVWVVAPESLVGKSKSGRGGLLAAISSKKSEEEQLEGKGRKRTARKKIMESVMDQKLLEKD